MPPPDASDDLVVPTPERVAFQYAIAGPGSRFLAQAIDLLILSVLFVLLSLGVSGLAAVTQSTRLATLIAVLLAFVLLFGYFLVLEALWSGRTFGKRLLGLRAVGDLGEPMHFSQTAIRNLVRIVDFLPVFYGIGLIALFINGRGKRLGDLAAGTLVVKEGERVNLYDLAVASSAAPRALPPADSIWSAPPASTVSGVPTAPDPIPLQLDPALRRLVAGYAARRSEIPLPRRQALAESAAPALSLVLPDLVAAAGPLAALDRLAEVEGVTPTRARHPSATPALTFGLLSLIASLTILLFPLGVIFGILAIIWGNRAQREVRAHSDRLYGAERGKTGRVLGIAGLVVAALALGVWIVAAVGR